MVMPGTHIAILLNSLPMGGAERAMLSFAGEAVRLGCRVDLVLVRKRGDFLSAVPPGIEIVEIGRCNKIQLVPWLLRAGGLQLAKLVLGHVPSVVRSLPFLVRYLSEARPQALLTTLHANNLAAIWAKRLSGCQTQIMIREASTISLNLAQEDCGFSKQVPALARRWYGEADGIVAVSEGAAEDLASFVGLPRSRVVTVYNSVDFDRVQDLAAEPLEDPWFTKEELPLFVTVGRLDAAKDIPTLLAAFAKVRAAKPCRLAVVGEGKLRSQCEALLRSLALTDCVRLVGRDSNPFRYIANAKVFVLSSAYEGFPNVLLEAMACGCPVVSTDCRSGPRELLSDGRFGHLVPVGDSDALAEAMLNTLASPKVPRDCLLERARVFNPERIARQYLGLLLGSSETRVAESDLKASVGASIHDSPRARAEWLTH